MAASVCNRLLLRPNSRLCSSCCVKGYHHSALRLKYSKGAASVVPKKLLCEEEARDYIYTLKAQERRILLGELQKFEAEMQAEDSTKAATPTKSQLKLVFLHNMLPFIGFGFLDNVLMISSGEYIDNTFGAVLGISTMAAAGLGNMVSDIAGLGTASYVELWASRIGVHIPPLSLQQADMKKTRWTANMGRVIGISIGCLLGMFPLLFFKSGNDDNEAADKEKNF